MRQPFFGQQIETNGDPGGIVDSARALTQRDPVRIGVFAFRRREQLGRKPEHALRFVRLHELVDHGLEVAKHFDFRERFPVFRFHAGSG